MAAMVHKAGTALQTGATACMSGAHTQTDTRAAAGELEFIRDATGADLSAYVKDPHTEMTFDAVLESSVEDKEIGDIVTIANGSYMVMKWEVQESNDAVKKVSIGVRSTTLQAASTSTNATPAATGTGN